MSVARSLGRSVPALRRRGCQPEVEDFDPPGLTVPRTRFNGSVTAHRVIDARWFPLDTAKRIRANVEGATINDVALTVVAGAMRSYLLAKGELPEQTLVSMIPVSTRTKEEAGTGGNRVSMIRAPL